MTVGEERRAGDQIRFGQKPCGFGGTGRNRWGILRQRRQRDREHISAIAQRRSSFTSDGSCRLRAKDRYGCAEFALCRPRLGQFLHVGFFDQLIQTVLCRHWSSLPGASAMSFEQLQHGRHFALGQQIDLQIEVGAVVAIAARAGSGWRARTARGRSPRARRSSSGLEMETDRKAR